MPGIENLSLCDYHDKCFGVWRTPEGKHHRIDVVVVAFPEERSFALLAWTGSRTFNRLCRLRAIHLGLNLGPHNFTARERVTVVLDARAQPPVQLELPPLGVLPFEHCRTEEDMSYASSRSAPMISQHSQSRRVGMPKSPQLAIHDGSRRWSRSLLCVAVMFRCGRRHRTASACS